MHRPGRAAPAAAEWPRRRPPASPARRRTSRACTNLTSSTLLNWCWRMRPAGVPAVGAGLGPEARRVGHVVDGQLVAGQEFRPGAGWSRALPPSGSGTGPSPSAAEHVLGELGQLARADHAGRVGQKRRPNFRVAVLLGVHVKHEVDEGPLQARPAPRAHREAGAGDLAPPARSPGCPGPVPMSQWALGSKSNCRGSPQRRTSTLSSSLSP